MSHGDPPTADNHVSEPAQAQHKRAMSGGLLSKLSFLRASADCSENYTDGVEGDDGRDASSPKKAGRAMAVVVQQQKTRRRKGSLRKAALLGRGLQRERKELEASPLQTHGLDAGTLSDSTTSPASPEDMDSSYLSGHQLDAIINSSTKDLDVERDSGNAVRLSASPRISPLKGTTSPIVYASTTDEEDVLTMAKSPVLRSDAATLSGSDEYFPSQSGLLTRRRSQNTKSPLSLPTNPIPVPDEDWDYSETAWWGWIILVVTWMVFVMGMGSCFGVWSWAWDVGETPYAPPELEDDPTLPIVGYYPALIILTAVMAWVWVVVAWVGMKYFKHAKISGD